MSSSSAGAPPFSMEHGCAFGLSRPPSSLDVGFPAVGSIADIQATVKAAARAPAGEWIRGNG
ncbi:hypothetical protein [Actinomadura madurae]|uniref:hypothetical protein n=1 Tax=Actinomadura madurae TaxID=1993 RepID=UPI000D889C0D|nr:hypothetical protein [Actinomadura madurae]SPT50164.1 Uncharacterised protein [Actinomadura madurae]